MYLDLKEIGQHVRISRTLDRVAHFSREPRDRRRERVALNRFEARNAVRFNPTPRLVRPEQPRVISFTDFLASVKPAQEVERVELASAQVQAFDKRQQVADEAGL